MSYYLLQTADTQEGWQALLKIDLEERIQYLSAQVEKFGGKVEGCWGAFGKYDWVMIYQMPDNESAAAFAIALASGGAVKACKTTPLMTVTETAAAVQKAAASGYQPPK